MCVGFRIVADIAKQTNACSCQNNETARLPDDMEGCTVLGMISTVTTIILHYNCLDFITVLNVSQIVW